MTAALSWRWLLASALVACAVAPDACAATRARWLMGTLWTASADGDGSAAALDAALDTVAALERSLSNWSPASELSRLNAAGGGIPSEPLCAVIDSARALAAATEGAFDPTVEPLSLAWDLRGAGRVPSEAQLVVARDRVGWERLSVDREHSRVELHGALLDLGGIAKGFALDRAAAVLAARGVAGASLDAGGQRLLPGGEPCSVWVAHPEQRDRAAVCLVLAAGSLSTSAQSERSLGHGRHRIGHILDPRSGRPAPTHASVSVFARSGTRADALSTALLVLGRERARAFAIAHRELGVLWLEPDGTRVTAEAWNLDVAAAAPFVVLVPTNSASLARSPSLP